MADDTKKINGDHVDAALGDMKLEEGESSVEEIVVANGTEETDTPREPRKSRSSTPATKHSPSQSPVKMQSARESSNSNSEEGEDEDVIGGDITLIVEPGKAPKLSRKSTQKVVSRHPPLFNDVEDATEEASAVFQLIKDCIYGSRYMGSTEHDTFDCDCSEEWRDGKNHACGDDSDCINRATKMECTDDCNCGQGCENQRFLRRKYANVSVFKTEKKGYGLRANTDLNTGDFVFEYIGEVINEPTFRRRMVQYDQEGVKHFYFMSLTKNEFVDATKKGNLGRFCNHSCNPNCFVDKWVVGEKLRMGIFAERPIQKGEELVFNYNVDRYGTEPVPCYCAEPNCTGFIGGKTQTERATNLSNAVIAALGIDDGNGWDTAVAKKPRKKKSGENDEEYINNVQPRGLDEDGVRKVMAALMQCKEKWLAVKFLDRIRRCDDDRVRNKVVQMHGYQILRTTLTTFKDDDNVILQVLDILYKLPRLTRNKISDSKIEAAVSTLVESEHEDVAFESKRLIEDWSKLEVAYRIPRKKWDPNAVGAYERRPAERPEEVVKSPTPTLVAPTGPKNSGFQRAPFQTRPPPPRRIFALPTGWYETKDERGNTYYYSKAGQTTWQRPYLPAAEPPPPPKEAPKSVQAQKALNDIIQSIVAAGNSSTPTRGSTTGDSTPKAKEKPVEKWRSYSEEKQMKMYENTLFPHIKHVMQKFSKQLPKDDLKKFAKEVGKKLVASDFKNKRVEDPTKISEKQEKKVKQFVRGYFEKAVEKRKAIDKRKQQKLANGAASSTPVDTPATSSFFTEMNGASPLNVDEDADTLSVDTPTPAVEQSPSILPATPLGGSPDQSRKRTLDEISTPETDSHKRLKEGDDSVPTPPPPPPPPAGDMSTPDTPIAEKEETEEERELRLQEEELMRENEEAMMMDLDGSLGNGGVSTFNVDAALASRNKKTFELNATVGVNGKASNGTTNGNRIGAEDEKMGGVEISGQAHDREEAI